MYYIHYYTSQSAHTEDYKRVVGGGGKYEEPWVDFVAETEEVHYNLPPMDWSTQYLTFKALEGGTFTFSGQTISYSIDGGKTWTSLAGNGKSPMINKDAYIMWKFETTQTTSTSVGRFSSTGNYEAMGNPYSLLYGDDFEGKIDLTGKNYALDGLFSDSTGLTSAENLSLPATTLANFCYRTMFSGCTKLTTAPSILPATTLASYCYNQMFRGCTSLTTAPALPATTLANYCYGQMFYGCTSLTTAPSILPATTLANGCYFSMFVDCTSLVTAPEILAETLARNCSENMFYGCTSLATAPSILPATTLAYACYSKMFNDCTSLTTAPELPATTLSGTCYSQMFRGCTSLTTAPELPATTLASSCYERMFSGCTNLNYIKAMFTTTPSTAYTKDWVSGVASSGTFVKNSAATWDVTGVNGIPNDWTVETASA